jgi:hypothetical protein
MPWVYGLEVYARGDIANVLLAITGDANTSIHSTQAWRVLLFTLGHSAAAETEQLSALQRRQARCGCGIGRRPTSANGCSIPVPKLLPALLLLWL